MPSLERIYELKPTEVGIPQQRGRELQFEQLSADIVTLLNILHVRSMRKGWNW